MKRNCLFRDSDRTAARSWLNPMLTLACAMMLAVPLPASEMTFGFTGPEIFPIDSDITNLRAADLDGDGLTDLVVADNAHSKIALLYNQTGKTNREEAVSAGLRELNELPPDARFKLDSIASEKRIYALAVRDLDGDDRPDLAYYGEPNELVVHYNKGDREWSIPKRWPIADVQLSPNALAVGDVNGDQLTDLVLLGENRLYILTQNRDRSLVESTRLPFSGEAKSVQILDIDGNDFADLLLVDWDSQNPFRFRLQNERGQIGPENHFVLPPLRSYWADDLDGDHKTEVITIARNSGRAQIYNFARQKAPAITEHFHEGQFNVLPLNKTTKARRGLAWADVDGDGLQDLLVAEPDSGQLSVYLQGAEGSLPRANTFPSLTGVTDLLVLPPDKESPARIYLLSQDERRVGTTRFDEQGRIAFPSSVPLPGRPLVMAAGRFGKPGSAPSLAVLVEQSGEGRILWTRQGDQPPRTQKLSSQFQSNPVSMSFHDADQDGFQDLVILVPYEKIKLLRYQPDEDFAELDIAPPGGSLEQPWISAADLDGDGLAELLFAQKNFVRAVVLEKEPAGKDVASQPGTWNFVVKDQVNGASRNSRIVGAAALAQPDRPAPALFLLDAESKALSLCQRDEDGVWQVARNLPLPYARFQQLQPVSIGGSDVNSIAFLGENAVAWMALSGLRWELEELDGYESPVKGGRLMDVVSGDLNQDGRKDLVFLETARNHVELVIYQTDGSLRPAIRWQVFEERTFRSRRVGDRGEPREALIVDVTGDGKRDLALVVHDRILVYPQE